MHGQRLAQTNGLRLAQIHGQGLAQMHGQRLAQIHGQRLAQMHGQRWAQMHGQRWAQTNGLRLAQIHGQGLAQMHGPRLAQIHGQRLAQMHGQRLAQMHGQRLAQTNGQRLAQIHGQGLAQMHGQRLAQTNGQRLAHKFRGIGNNKLTIWTISTIENKKNTTSFGCAMSRTWPGRICRLLKNSIFLSICTIFWSHEFVRKLIPSLLQFFVAFHVEKMYLTCSRRGCALLYRWFSGPWRPGPFPSRPIYQRAVAHEQ